MPSSQTDTVKLDKAIADLESRSQGGISEKNERHLEFVRLWRKYAGRDVVLVLVPRGVVRRKGEQHKGKIIEVHDQVAADLLAFAPNRGQYVREATPAEIELYRDYNRRQTAAAQSRISAEKTELARQQLASLLGTNIPASEHQAGAQPTAVLAPLTIDVSKPAEDADPPDAEPVTVAVTGDGPGVVPGTPLDGLALEDAVAEALRAAGYDSIEKLAAARPDELTGIEGVTKATAARMITKAATALGNVDADHKSVVQGYKPLGG